MLICTGQIRVRGVGGGARGRETIWATRPMPLCMLELPCQQRACKLVRAVVTRHPRRRGHVVRSRQVAL